MLHAERCTNGSWISGAPHISTLIKMANRDSRAGTGLKLIPEKKTKKHIESSTTGKVRLCNYCWEKYNGKNIQSKSIFDKKPACISCWLLCVSSEGKWREKWSSNPSSFNILLCNHCNFFFVTVCISNVWRPSVMPIKHRVNTWELWHMEGRRCLYFPLFSRWKTCTRERPVWHCWHSSKKYAH